MVQACVDSLLPQCRAAGAQLVVVRSPSAPGGLGAVAWDEVYLVEAPRGATVPQLRGVGLVQTIGDPVLLTEDLCVAEDGWVAALSRCDAHGADVVGGRMAIQEGGRAVDRGAFFSEYGFFGGVGTREDAPLLTGANVAYRRSVVDLVAEWAGAGDWENVIHDRLRQRGRTFEYRPEAVVYQRTHNTVWAFCGDRFQHGYDYARARISEGDTNRRWMWLAGTPLLPWILMARVSRAVGSHYRGAYLRALPWTLAFLAFWSLGETIGYLRGPLTTESAAAT